MFTCTMANEASKSSKKRSKHKKRSDTHFRRMYYFKKRRKCDFCRKFFFNETCLMMHKTSSCPQLWPYPCERCGNRYKNKGKLREHILSKCGTEKVFVCKVCNNSYLYERQLVEHITPVCKNSLLYRCDDCNYRFKSQERLNEHILSKCDREKVFKCDTCEKQYILKSQLIEHLTPICRALRRLKCEHCEMTFKTARLLNLHKSNAHGIGNEILCDQCGKVVNGHEQFIAHRKKHRLSSSDFNKYDIEDKSYLCKFCGKCLKSKVTLRTHLRTHSDGHLLACTICGKSVSSFSLRAHMRTHANVVKDFSCRLCQKRFQRRRCLERHMASHSNEKPHFCRDCGKSFASIDQLNSHSAQHTGFKSHFCNICGNSYLNGISLKRHVQRVHLSKKNNICTQCGKRFQALKDLLDHHQYEPNCAETKCEVKPYVCNDCETAFESLESFSYHHTGINLNDQPLVCNICGKFFPRITCLNSHLLTHQQTFICVRCGESFGDSLSLGLHNAICGIIQNVSNNEFMLTTCDDKVCICNQCGEKFDNIYDLTCHAMTHIGNEPLKFESVDIKSTAENLFEDSNIRKQITIDVPLKFESVANFSLPDTPSKDYFDLTQVSDLPIKFEDVPGISLPLDNSPKDSYTLPFSSDMALALNYETGHEITSTFDNHLNIIHNERTLHLISDEPIKRFICNICGKCLAHSRSLRRHMKVHSRLQYKNGETTPITPLEQAPEVKPVTCEVCRETFREMQHLKCHVCKVHPTTIKGNLLHNNNFMRIDEPIVMSHVPVSEDKRVLCNGCGRAFSEMRHLKRHICKVHSTSTENNPPQDNCLEQTEETAGALPTHERKPVTCGGCGRAFKEMRHLKRHICKVHSTSMKNNPPQENCLEQTEETAGALPTHERKPVACGGCGRTFSEIRHLKRHICKERSTEMQTSVLQGNCFTHIDDPLVIPPQEINKGLEANKESAKVLSMPLLHIPDCTDIGGLTSSKHDALRAEKTTPECHKCHKKFSSSWSLKKHNTNVNCLPTDHLQTQVEPISCDVCGKTFQQRYKLNRHKIVHLTDTPFKCCVCSKAFKQDRPLQNHMVEAHSLTSSESFRCDVCGKLFAIKGRLQDHIRRIHRKFKCNECEIIFSKRSKLTKHKMTVHGETSKCRICHLVSPSIDRLVEHLRFKHKEVIDESASSEDLISMYRDEDSTSASQNAFSQDLISMCSDESSPPEEKQTDSEEISRLETKRVKLKLPQDDENMLMFEAYESLLLEACPLEPSVLAKKVNGDINHESCEEELVKLEYVLGS